MGHAWVLTKSGAANEARTRDLNVGKIDSKTAQAAEFYSIPGKLLEIKKRHQ
jgi:hypothetical protein